MGSIETGVDKLVDIINQRKKITVDEAAKLLGVSTLVVQEWAEFLEEEQIISVEYSLSKVYLVERKLSKKEVQGKEKEYSAQKDAFVRKVESALKSLDSESLALDKVRKEFENLKKELESEMGSVRKDLDELKKYDALKGTIDKDIEGQKDEFTRIINSSRRQILSEEADYKKLIQEIQLQRQAIQNEKSSLKNLDDNETAIAEKISQLNESLQKIFARANDEREFIRDAENNLDRLTKLSTELEEDIRDKKDSVIEPLVKISEEHRNKVLKVQEELLKAVEQKRKEIDDYAKTGKAVSKKFSDFFGEKNHLTVEFDKIQKDADLVRKSLNDLIKKAKSFNLASKVSIKKYSQDLDAEFTKAFKTQEDLKKRAAKLAAEISKQ